MTSTPKYHLSDSFDPASAHPFDSHSIQARLIPSGSRVLELGCASGYMSSYLERAKGCTVIGLDSDPVAIDYARRRINHAFVADLEGDDPLKEAALYAPFDVLYAANVLEHIRSASTVLKVGRKLLKPGGIAVVALPNVAHWSIRLKLLKGEFRYTDYGIMDRTHVTFYTLSSARELLESAGFKITATYIAGSFLQNLVCSVWSTAPLILPNLLAYEFILLGASQGAAAGR